jgi:hypothetical protein
MSAKPPSHSSRVFLAGKRASGQRGLEPLELMVRTTDSYRVKIWAITNLLTLKGPRRSQTPRKLPWNRLLFQDCSQIPLDVPHRIDTNLPGSGNRFRAPVRMVPCDSRCFREARISVLIRPLRLINRSACMDGVLFGIRQRRQRYQRIADD